MSISSKNGQIKIRMLRMGINQILLAKKIGIGNSYLSQIINSKRNPSPVLAKKIADELNCEIDDIFTIEGGE